MILLYLKNNAKVNLKRDHLFEQHNNYDLFTLNNLKKNDTNR